MKIATYNVNNVNRRIGPLLEWLVAAEPDVVCLQELKSTDARFPHAAFASAGYGAIWRGQSAWNGVAILARGTDPVPVSYALVGDPDDDQARYIEAAVDGVLIASLYSPNGNPAPGPKFDAKLAWTDRLIGHAAELMAAGVPVVLAGDYNIAPEPVDVYPTRSYDGNALILPEARARWRALLDQGWVDAIRAVYPAGPVYTFWDYRRNRFERDGGMRLDHLLLGGDLPERLSGAGVDRWVRGLDDASDHAPVWIEIA